MENNNKYYFNEDEYNLYKNCSGKSLSELCEEDYFKNELKENTIEFNLIINEKATYIPFPNQNIFKKDDFEFIGNIGRGTYAKVVKAKLIRDNTIYAVKIINRPFIEKQNKIYQVYLENEILSNLTHDNIIKILGIFEDNQKLYIILEYCACGDFYDFLKDNAPLPFETAQFFTAQIVSALEYLHEKNISHRDLKPENLMLDEKMHIKMIDFATAKIHGREFNRKTMKFDDVSLEDEPSSSDYALNLKKKNTFLGTAEYLSPEVLNDQIVGPETDLWALGCIIYQMFTGNSPFKEKTEYLVFRKIIEQNINYPTIIPEKALSIIKLLLNPEPKQRLGAGDKGSENDFEAMKKHAFFEGIDFNNLVNMELPNKNKLKLNIFYKEKIPKRSYSQGNQINEKENFEDNITIVKEGLVKKKSPWFHYNTRKIILYTSHKIEYIDPTNKSVRGVIFLSKECKSTLIENDRFDLITPNRTFIFKTENNEANEWNKLINDMIESIN